jgi:hypothetical protein
MTWSLSENPGEARRRGASSGVCTRQMSSARAKSTKHIRGFRIGSYFTFALIRLTQQNQESLRHRVNSRSSRCCSPFEPSFETGTIGRSQKNSIQGYRHAVQVLELDPHFVANWMFHQRRLPIARRVPTGADAFTTGCPAEGDSHSGFAESRRGACFR